MHWYHSSLFPISIPLDDQKIVDGEITDSTSSDLWVADLSRSGNSPPEKSTSFEKTETTTAMADFPSSDGQKNRSVQKNIPPQEVGQKPVVENEIYNSPPPTLPDGSVPFFLLDVYEEPNGKSLYLFGKVISRYLVN